LNFSFYIARRYFLSKSKNNAINIISYLALIGIFGTSMALFVVLSAFGGLKEFSLSFANKYDPDLKVLPLESKRITVDQSIFEGLLNIEGVAHVSKVIEEKVLLSYKDKDAVAVLKAVDENFDRVNGVENSVFAGQWLSADSPYQVVIGNGLSRQLSIGIRDQSGYLNFIVPKPGKGQITNPEQAFRKIPGVVRGVFGISEEYNNTYIFSELQLARELLDFGSNEFSAVEIATEPNADVESIQKKIQSIFNEKVEVKTRLQLNDELYKMLNTENLMVYLICTLVVIISLFNLIGAVIMAIIDKKENIKTLSDLGATPTEINQVFFYQGLLSSVLGSVIGIISGVLLVFLQLEFELINITSSLPYPVKISFLNLVIVLGTTIGLGVAASKIASSRAGKLA
jgi:lipoprotein-releasing system permease protein